MSNAERQAEFRRCHPDYNRQYKARMRAAMKALVDARAVEATRVAAEPLALPAPIALPVRPVQLLLPAPVAMPVLPGINTIAARPTLVPIPRTNSAAA